MARVLCPRGERVRSGVVGKPLLSGVTPTLQLSCNRTGLITPLLHGFDIVEERDGLHAHEKLESFTRGMHRLAEEALHGMRARFRRDVSDGVRKLRVILATLEGFHGDLFSVVDVSLMTWDGVQGGNVRVHGRTD